MKRWARLLDVAARAGSGVMLVSLYRFLYAPIAYIVFTSLSKNIAWPFPLKFSLRGDELLYIGRTYHEALYNSLILGIGSAPLGTFFATAWGPNCRRSPRWSTAPSSSPSRSCIS